MITGMPLSLKGLFFFASVLLISRLSAQEQLPRISADNQIYYAHDTHTTDSTFRDLFEDWSLVSFGYGDFEANVQYEAHLPQPSWSSDTTGQGIYERWISFKRQNLSITVGNFYALLGKGLTLHSLNSRDMRYNTNIDGATVKYTDNLFDVTALGGRPRDLAGVRLNPLLGGEVRLTPMQWGFLGATFVQTHMPATGLESRWGSTYLQLQRPLGTLYTEFASRDCGQTNDNSNGNFLRSKGTASYTTANVFIGKVSALLEATYYNSFDISEGEKNKSEYDAGPGGISQEAALRMYNTPPPGIFEHSQALMNRAIPTLFANNHVAWHAGATYALSDQNNMPLNYSRSRTVKPHESGGIKALSRCADIISDSADYQDLFAKGEFVFPEKTDWTAGCGYQQTLEARYFNFVGSNDWGIAENYSMQGSFEHQWAEISLTQRKFYSQIYSLCLARAAAPRLSLSLIVERTTDQYSDKQYWIGTQIDWTFYETNSLSIFAGNRKKGKLCAGGVCVNKPEFSGVEMAFTAKL